MAHRLRTTVIAVVLLGALAAGTALAPSASAATWPGALNVAWCNPNNHTIYQEMEVYRTAGEVVYLRSVLVDAAGRPLYGQWVNTSSGVSAHASSTWTNVGGSYTVWTQVAVWNAAHHRWDYSNIRLDAANVMTYGTESMSGVYFGTVTGSCRA